MPKIKGEKVRVVVKASGTELVLASQQGGSLDLSASTLDATSKDSNGFEEYEAGLRSASVSCDGLVVVSDPAYRHLLAQFVEGEKVDIEIQSEENDLFEFSAEAIITSAPISFGYDELLTYSFDFQVSGRPDFGSLIDTP